MPGKRTICLLPHCAYLSETTRMLAIRRALVARGADVCVATHGGTHERILREENVPYTQIGPRFTEERCREFIRMGAGMGPPSQSMWSDEEMRVYVDAEARFFRENSIAVAVTGFTLTTLLSTRVAKIPLVTEHAGSYVPPVWEGNRVEAFLNQMIPGARYLPRFVQRFLNNRGIDKLQLYCAGFNRVAAQLGVPGVPSFAALLLADLALVPDTPEVLGIPEAEMNAWRPRGPGYWPTTRLKYTGPIFAELECEMPEAAARFLDAPGPKIYVAITSAQPDEIRRVVLALRPTGARILVAGTVHDLGDLAGDKVVVERVLPSHRVMPRVDLAVTAGGQGSVQCAMAAGTPLIAIPLQGEQDFNGQIVERHHAGARITMSDAMTPKIAALASAILGDPRYREGAQWIRASYAKVDGPGKSADAILELIGAVREQRPDAAIATSRTTP